LFSPYGKGIHGEVQSQENENIGFIPIEFTIQQIEIMVFYRIE